MRERKMSTRQLHSFQLLRWFSSFCGPVRWEDPSSKQNNPFSNLSVTYDADIFDWIDVADPSRIECKVALIWSRHTTPTLITVVLTDLTLTGTLQDQVWLSYAIRVRSEPVRTGSSLQFLQLVLTFCLFIFPLKLLIVLAKP